MKIEFKIITRGTMIVYYGDKKVIIHGEIIYKPLYFWAWKNSFIYWESPYENIRITEKEKEEIIEYVTKASQEENQTKIIFD